MMQPVTLELEAGGDGQPLFVDFVNTLHWYEGQPIELIGTEVDFAAWLAARNPPARHVSGALPAMHVLRGHLRGVTEALATGRTPDEPDLGALHLALRTPAGHLVLAGAESQRPQLAFTSDASDVALFAFRVALSLAIFLESGDRHRLKLCANPGCGFAFVDTSTNGTRRWCFMRYCGNRFKVRDFRQRTRQRALRPVDEDGA